MTVHVLITTLFFIAGKMRHALGPRKRNYCIVKGCNNHDAEIGWTKMSSFQQDKCMKWTKSLGISDYGQYQYICHAHFDEEEDFIIGRYGYAKVKPHAVPSKNLSYSTLPILDNPWDVPHLDEYLFYCCPVCELKTKTYEDFYAHAVNNHKLARETLEASKTSSDERKTLDQKRSDRDLIVEASSKKLCGLKCPDCQNIIHPTLFEKHKKVCHATGNNEHADIKEVKPKAVNPDKPKMAYEALYEESLGLYELANVTLQSTTITEMEKEEISDEDEHDTKLMKTEVIEEISDKDEPLDKEVYAKLEKVDPKLLKAEVVLDKNVVDNFVKNGLTSFNEGLVESEFVDDDNYDNDIIDIKEECKDSDYSEDEMSTNHDPPLKDPLGKVWKKSCVVCPFYGPRSSAVKFPKSREVCEKWCESLGLSSYKKTHHVCLAHFSKDDFYYMKTQNRIKPSAVPKRQHPNPILKEIPTKKPRVKKLPEPKEPKKSKLTNVMCDKCDRVFKDEAGLRNHTKSMHPVETKKVATSCPICHKSFDMSYLSIHLKCVHKPEEVAALSSEWIPNSIEAAKSDNIKTETEECPVCMRMVSPDKLWTHDKVCTDMMAGWEEKKAKIEAKRQKALMKSLKETQCYFCGLLDRDSDIIRDHIKQVHQYPDIRKEMLGSPRTHQCKECNVMFKTSVTLKSHICGITNPSVNQQEPEQCPTCGLTFPNHRKFAKHYLKEHLNERRFKCDQCDKAYYWGARLDQHIKETHGERATCEICGKSFQSENHMKTHKAVVHDGKKKHQNFYRCKICEAKFTTNSSLRKHSFEMHNVEVPWQYPCTHCDRGFERKPLLMKHILKVHQITY